MVWRFLGAQSCNQHPSCHCKCLKHMSRNSRHGEDAHMRQWFWSSLVQASFNEFKLELQSGNTQFGSKWTNLLSRVTLKFCGWLWKTTGHLFYSTSSFVHHFIAIGEFKLELQSENAQFGSNRRFFYPCDFIIWRMTLKTNRAHLLWYFKLCASFYRHWSVNSNWSYSPETPNFGQNRRLF